jgi:hypothetical protein
MSQIQKLLKKHQAKHVNNFDEIKKLLDFSKLVEGVPQILTKEKSIIIVDHKVFNYTYVIDIINKFLDEDNNKECYKHVKIYYIDDVDIIKLLFPKRGIISTDLETIPICIISINPDTNDVNIYEEVMAPINENDVKVIFENLRN